MIYWIDLFCGAGGTTTGIHLSDAKARVIACVNHDEVAIQSHKENHPECLHLTEDIRDPKVVRVLKGMVTGIRKKDPDAVINIWASLECTNYSKAKGGLPRDADSRTLAHSMFMYIEDIDPDYLYIENVREFMAWGPLDKNGRPISRKNGTDYVKWCNRIQSHGYNYDWKLLNSADYGAYTSRERYFGIFAKKGMPISWPEPTHARNVPSDTGMFDSRLEKWKAVRDVLDLKDEGKSIFDRKKPLVENTLKRIYAGLVKFVANRDESFLKKYFSGSPNDKVIRLDAPAGTITCKDHHALIKCNFLQTYYGNGGVSDTNEPCPTITTKDRVAKIFITNYYSGGGQLSSVEEPSPSILGVPKQRIIECKFLDQQYGMSKPSGIDKPAGTLTGNPKLNIVTAKPWLMDTNFNNVGSSVDEPSRTIVAARKHHYLINPNLIQSDSGQMAIAIYDTDSEMTVKIKQFMAAYGIIDIKMRMLKIPELLRIQGFPDDYKLRGTKTDQKKFIGNSVVPLMAKKLVKANAEAVNVLKSKIA